MDKKKPTTKRGEIELSAPRNFQQGVHIGYNETGKFTGVPRAWADAIGGGKSTEGDDTVVDYSGVQATSIKPTLDDIDFVLRSPARPKAPAGNAGNAGPRPLPQVASPRGGTVTRPLPPPPSAPGPAGAAPLPAPTPKLGPAPGSVSPPPVRATSPSPSSPVSSPPLSPLAGLDIKRLLNNSSPVTGDLAKGALAPNVEESIYASEANLEREKQRKLRAGAGNMELDLSSLRLTDIPEEAIERDKAHLTCATLNLSFNAIERWPARLPVFTCLQRLNLDGNKLSFIPPDIKELIRLRELTINGNDLGALPAEIGFLRDLERLELSNNRLTSLPDEIGYLEKLEELHVTGNQLEVLPDHIGYLKALEVLDASCCQLEEIPETIGYNFKLMELNLGVNILDTLPDSIGCLTRLCALNLSDNQLVSLPYTLGNLYSVQKLYIDGNLDLDDELHMKGKQGTDQLMDTLEKRMESEIEDVKGLLKESRPPLPRLPPLPGTSQVEKNFLIDNRQGRIEVKDKSDTPQGGKSNAEIAEQWDLQEKAIKLRVLAAGLRQQMNVVVRDWKLELSKVSAVEQGIPLAQKISRLKEEMAAVRAKVDKFSKGWKNPPMPTPGEDKLIVLKRTTAAALDNISVAIDALGTAIDTSQDIRVLFVMIKHLQNLNQLMAGPPPAAPGSPAPGLARAASAPVIMN